MSIWLSLCAPSQTHFSTITYCPFNLNPAAIINEELIPQTRVKAIMTGWFIYKALEALHQRRQIRRASHYSLLEITRGSLEGENIIQGPRVKKNLRCPQYLNSFYKRAGRLDFHHA